MQMFIVQMHQISKLHRVSKTKWFKIPFPFKWKSLEASTFIKGTQGSSDFAWVCMNHLPTQWIPFCWLLYSFTRLWPLRRKPHWHVTLIFSSKVWVMKDDFEWTATRITPTSCHDMFPFKTTQVNNLNRGGLSRGGNCENLLSPFLSH